MLPWILIILPLLPAQAAKHNSERVLYDSLLKDYNSALRPVQNPSKPIHIEIQLLVDQILSLDEKNEVMSSHVSFFQRWKDEFLTWNTSVHPPKMLYIPQEKMWGLDLMVKNSVGETRDSVKAFHRLQSSYAVVDPDGMCMSFSPFLLSTSCDMNMTMFPFDVQTCTIEAGSWMYMSDQVQMSLMNNPIEIRANNADFGEWKVTDFQATIKQVFEERLKKKYDRIIYSLTLKRNPKFYIYNIVAPAALVAFISTFSFLLPPDFDDRVSLGLTTLLTTSVYAMVVADHTPESSKSIPVLSSLMFLYMGVTAVATLWSVIVTRIGKFSKRYNPPPNTVLKICSFCAYFPLKKQEKENTTKKSKVKLVGLDHSQETDADMSKCPDDLQNTVTEQWNDLIIGLDKVFFVVFVAILVGGTIGLCSATY